MVVIKICTNEQQKVNNNKVDTVVYVLPTKIVLMEVSIVYTYCITRIWYIYLGMYDILYDVHIEFQNI